MSSVDVVVEGFRRRFWGSLVSVETGMVSCPCNGQDTMPNYIDNLTPEQREIARFLLADVTDEERDRITIRAISDDAYNGQMEAIEDGLIEAAVHGNLSPSETENFERYFLRSEERRTQYAALQSSCAKPADVPKVPKDNP